MSRTYTLQSPKTIAERVVSKMFGGKGSGNYGHGGLDNVWGGSSKGGGGGGLQKQAKRYKTADEFVESQVKTKNEVLYYKIGDRNIEIIKNPTSRDNEQITKEFKKEFPQGRGEPATRTSYDSEGNKYIWRSDKATHDDIENYIEKEFGVEANQNRYVVLDNRLTGIWKKIKND